MKFENNAADRFASQLDTVISLFKKWSDCERAVSLYAILKTLTFTSTRFVQAVIESNLQQTQCREQANILECANSPKYINSLSDTYKNLKCNDVQLAKDSIFYESDRSLDKLVYNKKEQILLDILTMMPILTTGNEEAKLAYLEFIPLIIEDATRRIVDETLVQQISCYVLIHPAFTAADRKSVSEPIRHLEIHLSSRRSSDTNLEHYRNDASPSSEPSKSHIDPLAVAPPAYQQSLRTTRQPSPNTSSFSENGKIVAIDGDDKDNTKILYPSLPEVVKVHDCIVNKYVCFCKKLTCTTCKESFFRRLSLPTVTKTPDPILNRSGSVDFAPCIPIPPTHHVGMGNMKQWLKDLRLHKYIYLFENITYEELLDVNYEYLNRKDVTDGARNKFLICIQKLKNRYNLLRQVENDLVNNKIPISNAVDELKSIITTPLKPVASYNEEDVPGQFVKVLIMVSETIAVNIVPQEEEVVSAILGILEKAVHNEAFVPYTNLLKEHRFIMQKIKSLLPRHYSSTGNIQRPRLPATRVKKPQRLANIWQNNSSHNDQWPIPPPTTTKRQMTDPSHLYGNKINILISDSTIAANDNKPTLQPRTYSDALTQKTEFRPLHAQPSKSIQKIINESKLEPLSLEVGMKNIPIWLKSLRLHKYNKVFENISYEHMFFFTEEFLKSLGITPGASRKLGNCIQKLTFRVQEMKQMELNLRTNHSIHLTIVLNDLRTIVLSPMKPIHIRDDDVGFQLEKILHLAFEIIYSNRYDEPTVNNFINLLDKAMQNEAFVGNVSLKRMKNALLSKRYR